jgi:hypothetical protein
MKVVCKAAMEGIDGATTPPWPVAPRKNMGTIDNRLRSLGALRLKRKQ